MACIIISGVVNFQAESMPIYFHTVYCNAKVVMYEAHTFVILQYHVTKRKYLNVWKNLIIYVCLIKESGILYVGDIIL